MGINGDCATAGSFLLSGLLFFRLAFREDFFGGSFGGGVALREFISARSLKYGSTLR